MNSRTVGAILAATAAVIAVAVVSTLPLHAAVHAGELRSDRYQRSSGSVRRAPIQRSPSRRALKIASYALGGVGLIEDHPCWRPLELPLLPVLGDGSDATPTPVPAPASHVYVSPVQDEARVDLSGQVYRYDPWLPAGLPFYCATEPLGPDRAYVIPPGPGDPLPAQVTEFGFGAYLLSFPFEVFSQPGTWTLVLDDVERYETRVEIAPFTAPTLLIDGNTMQISGFQPGEWVKLLFFAYVRSEDRGDGVQAWHNVWEEQGEASLIADDLGSILLERDSRYSIVAMGEETSGYVMDVLDSFSWNPSVLGIAEERDQAPEEVADTVLSWFFQRIQPGVDPNEAFGGAARAQFFPPDERPTPEPTATPTATPAPVTPAPPGGLPTTGAARIPAASAAMTGLAVVAALGVIALATKKREQR